MPSMVIMKSLWSNRVVCGFCAEADCGGAVTMYVYRTQQDLGQHQYISFFVVTKHCHTNFILFCISVVYCDTFALGPCPC